MNNKTIAIASVLMAVALTGILSTNPIAFAQDESETESEIKCKNTATASGESAVFGATSCQIGGDEFLGP
jgi:hypothetical protein